MKTTVEAKKTTTLTSTLFLLGQSIHVDDEKKPLLYRDAQYKTDTCDIG